MCIPSKARMAKEKKSVAMPWKDEASVQHPVISGLDQSKSGYSPEVEQGPAATTGGGQVAFPKSTIFKTLRSRTVMQSVLSSAPTTFELFMRLPLELRLMIWDLSKYDPRIIFAGSMSPQHRYCLNSLTHQPLPALPAGFQVHQESRRHFLKTYQALFFFSRGGGTTLYINPKVDMLLFYTISVDDPPADKATIERMAWHYGGPAWLIFGPKWSHIAIYPALKELVILWSHDLDCEWNLGHWSEERRWAEMSVGKPDHWVKGNKIDRFFCATKGEDGELPLPGKRSDDESRVRWSDGYVFRRIEQ